MTNTGSQLTRAIVSQRERKQTLTTLAEAMARGGMTPDAIKAALLVENTARCIPPLPDMEIRHIVRGLSTKPLACGDMCSRFEYDGGEFELGENGVVYSRQPKSGEDRETLWICSPLHIKAMTRDDQGHEWGRLLEWRDADGVLHQWAMPMELLQSDGADVRRELVRHGLTIAPGRGPHELLTTYLQMWPADVRVRCVNRLGWHGTVYVLPNGESVGESDEQVVFQNPHTIEPALSKSGTADEWREQVAALAHGNSRMVFAVSTAFAGVLLEPASEDSGGFHLRGCSSTGKSTALKLAASVWGNPSKYCRLWRATVNGLEGLAALHNDGLLVLDELGQVDPREAGEAAYLLANGRGKARATRTGTARQSQSWRLLFLSAGEESLSALMARAGGKPTAGQEIRLAEIDADAGAGMGALESLNGCPTANALALALRDAADKYYGAVGAEWLGAVVSNVDLVESLVAHGVREFVAKYAPQNATGQVKRVARRFGLVAWAGEIATIFDLTGWQQGEAETASGTCFRAWLESFGGAEGDREARALLVQVRAFFEQHGASRFQDVLSRNGQRVINRAGFFRVTSNATREHLVLPEAFKQELCKGHDVKFAVSVLRDKGWIVPGRDGRATQKPRLPGIGTTTRVYLFGNKMWEEE